MAFYFYLFIILLFQSALSSIKYIQAEELKLERLRCRDGDYLLKVIGNRLLLKNNDNHMVIISF